MAQLDQHVGTAGAERVAVDGIALKMAAIGFVLPHHDTGFAAQEIKKRQRQTGIEMGIEDADMPGPVGPPDEPGGEAVDGADHRIDLPRGQPFKRVVIGPVEGVQPPFDLGRIDVAVGRNDRAVIKLHHQCRVILAPVGVDHEAREIGQDRGRAQTVGQVPRQPGGADVIGDVAPHVGGRDAKGPAADAIRHPVGGMVAGDEPARGAVAVMDVKGLICHVNVILALKSTIRRPAGKAPVVVRPGLRHTARDPR